ncbi:glycosyltransferase family 2 protein [Flavobacterium sp. GT2N3]|uniref:glycosyltransferase family 2 protein n=1 Tax=unclassified Flavobacterium TaxID=196869 RepID=UPI003AABF636
MVNNILISIVIPCYNDVQYVEQSVLSALNQTYPNIEVIVVDDGSNAATKTVLKKLGPKITKLIVQENQGQSTARNVGIKAAKGEFIVTLDSDDFFEPTFCEKAIEVFLNKRDTKIVTCYANLLFEDKPSYVFKTLGGSIVNFLYLSDALGTSMFRKEDWESCGAYDEGMRSGFEDWEFFIRLLKDGGTAEVIKEPLYNYRKRSNSTSVNARKIKFELWKYILTKHKNLYIAEFDTFVAQMLLKIEREEAEKIKNIERLEYKIGATVLKPLRFVKSLFNK